MNLYEPATLITDYLLALVALVCGLLLRRNNPAPARSWFARTLMLSALSAFVGGSYHGFGPNFATEIQAIWWRATLIILSLVSAALALSLMHEVASPHRQSWLRSLIMLKLVVFVTLALAKPVFLFAIIDYGTALLAWIVTALVTRRPWRGWMQAAFGLSFVAAAVQQLQLSPSSHFNHNDLYHVIQAVAFLAFYRAGKRLCGPKV
jgi:hypothetical protein